MSARKHRPIDLATLTIHAGTEAATPDTPVVHPLFQSVNFVQEIGTGEGLALSALRQHAERRGGPARIAALEGAEAAVLLGSGMGATACALLALLRPGDHLIASSWIYGGASALLTKEFTPLGIEVSLVDPLDTRIWRKQLRKETRAIFLETPVNPTCRVLDLQPVSYVTKEPASRSSSTRRSRARSTSARSSTAPTSSSTRRRST